jgi:hypothetical protein
MKSETYETKKLWTFTNLYNEDSYRRRGYRSPGIRERYQQLVAIQNGIPGWCVLCEAVNANATPRQVARFDDHIYPITSINDDGKGNISAAIGAPVSRDRFLALIKAPGW